MPYGVEHYTLWSIDDMSHQQVRAMFCDLVVLRFF